MDVRVCAEPTPRRPSVFLFPTPMQLHSGPVTGGIVGRTRAFYRVYGETVNVASRMMSHGMPSTLHCSWSTAALLASSPSFGED